MIPDSFIQELILRIDIVDLISEYVSLKKSGRNYMGLCPFHNEKTPSFCVNPEKNFFHCFGCSVGGDAISFIMRIENMSYPEAIKYLAGKVGLEVPVDNNAKYDKKKLEQNQRLYQINKEAARFFYTCLQEDIGKNAMQYLKSRNIKPSVITHFGLGFAPGNARPLIDYLKSKGFDENDIILANLAVKNDQNKVFDRFYNRLMFPIINKMGHVIAFGGRTLSDSKPKYLNTSDTPIFKKSDNLYALNFAKNYKGDEFILAEGYMDVISLHAAGFTNAVASLGTSLTLNQAKLISRHAKTAIIAYDSDQAGQAAASRAIPILRQAGLNTKVLKISGGKDPDEFINSDKNGAIKFKQMLNESKDDIEYSLEKIQEKYDLNLNKDKVEFLKEAVDFLSKIGSKIEREVYSLYLSEKTGVDKQTILIQLEAAVKINKELQKKQYKVRSKIKSEQHSSKEPVLLNSRAKNAQEAILAYLFEFPENFEFIIDRIKPEYFIYEDDKKIFEILIKIYEENKSINFNILSKYVSLSEISRLTAIFSKYSIVKKTKEDALNYIKIIKAEYEKRQMEDNKNLDNEKIKEYIKKLREQKN